jgi:hypothetical protein
MSWFASSTNETEAAKEHYLMFIAVDFDFPSGHIYFWSGIGNLTIGANTYIGTGDLGAVSMPEERSSLTFEPKVYQLSGVDPALIPESDIDDSFGRSVVEYFGFLNTTTRTLLDTPETNWEGRIDSIRRVRGSRPLIEVKAEHRLALLDQSDDWLFTHEHQQQFFAGDLGFDRIPSLELKELKWGGVTVTPGRGGREPRGGHIDHV